MAERRPAVIGMITGSRTEDQWQRRFVTGSQELLPRARQLIAERDRSGRPPGGGSKQIADSLLVTQSVPGLPSAPR